MRSPLGTVPDPLLDAVILSLVDLHVGCPCPTMRDLMGWTGMPRRRVWGYLDGMAERGVIEIEVGRDPRIRRMRRAGGLWTLRTARGRRWGRLVA